MKLIKPSIQFLWMTNNPLQTIEKIGRTCYKSENKITPQSASGFVKMLIEKGHEAMIEHASISYRVICDRGVTHEIVRHRLFSYAQESTRYCNYNGRVTYVLPPWVELDEGEYLSSDAAKDVVTENWLDLLLRAEESYTALTNYGWVPQQSRSVLPNALKTEIVITGNLREWHHFFRLRTSKTAHPQMQEIANMLLKDVRIRVPVIFENLTEGPYV